MTTTPLVTVAVVPRERFNHTLETIQSIKENTEEPHKLIIVDGNSPPDVKNQIDNATKDAEITVIRKERYLTPNEARNLASERCVTKYIVFVDNDVLVQKGWLSSLVTCAEDTEAVLVGPLYMEGRFERERIHMAGGEAQIIEKEGKKFIHSRHKFGKKYLWQVNEKFMREETELLEFHCMLAHTDFLRKIGGLDEQLPSLEEHFDICMQARSMGKKVYFEPNSVITYNIDKPMSESDKEYFLLRWSDDWNRKSMRRIAEKWNIDPSDPSLEKAIFWGGKHRAFANPPKKTFARKIKSRIERFKLMNKKQIARLKRSFNR